MAEERLRLHYKDIFWSSDHITGINALIQTTEKGLLEGKICFNYLQNHSSILELETSKLIQFFHSQDKLLSSNNVIISQESDDILNGLGYKNKEDFRSIQDISFQQVESLKDLSNDKQQFLSQIQSDVLLRLGDFLEDYKSFSSDLKSDLLTQYTTYKKSLQTVESTKSKFYTKSRQLDDYTNPNSDTLTDELPTMEEPQAIAETQPIVSQSEVPQIREVDSDDGAFQFPLIIGSTTFADEKILRGYINSALAEIPQKRRVIPLPGINNEYFTSENLTKWIRKNFANEDTRRKVEKFGQNLISLGLISNWNKLAQNLFVSDGGYYEFTDLARFVVKFDGAVDEEPVNVTVTRKVEQYSAPQKATSATDVWSGLKNRWVVPGNVESLKEQRTSARNQYIEAVKAATTNKERLEILLIGYAKKAQVFDTNRVKLFYELQRNFHQNLISRYQSQIKALESHLSELDVTEELVDIELLQPVLNLPIGWYWSKSEANFIDHINQNSPNIAIFGVDLVSQFVDPSVPDLKDKSAPLFILQALNRLTDIDYSIELWIQDIDISSATELKQWSLLQIAETSEEDAKERLFSLLDQLFEENSIEKIINFLKLWLLELPDSLLPFTIYDTLVQQYDKNEDKALILQTIGTIPRQNLSTLLHLISHLDSKFTKAAESLTVHRFRVPFVHLFLRPAPKKSHLNIQDTFILSPLISDLLSKEFQDHLHLKLIEMEQYHQEKERRAEESINRLKDFRRDSSPTPPNRNSLGSSHLLTSDGLRAFKTKSPLPSPAPSRGTSPIVSPTVKPAKTHTRVSSLLSSPVVRRPSDSLSKRHSQI